MEPSFALPRSLYLMQAIYACQVNVVELTVRSGGVPKTSSADGNTGFNSLKLEGDI